MVRAFMVLSKPSFPVLQQFLVGCSISGETAFVFTKNDNNVINILGNLTHISIWHLPL